MEQEEINDLVDGCYGTGDDGTSMIYEHLVEDAIRKAISKVENNVAERCAKIASDHEHEPDDFVCGGQNCGIIISATILAEHQKKGTTT